MKRIAIIAGLVLGIALLFPTQKSFAQMGMMGNYYNNDASTPVSQTEQQNQQKLDAMVNDLLTSQNVSSKENLDCTKIPNDQLEKLGDAWMDVMVPDENAHQAMDTMMGGDRSDSLTAMHIGMAERYLGCQNAPTAASTVWGPMMGNNVYGYGPANAWINNAANDHFAEGFGWLGLLVESVAFVDLILLGIVLVKKIKKKETR